MAIAMGGRSPITLSHHDYWALIQESAEDEQNVIFADDFDMTLAYPSQLGQGFVRSIYLRDGLELAIANYQVHDDVITTFSDREHPLEYTFDLPSCPQDAFSVPYHLHGSGIAPGGRQRQSAQERTAWVSVHLEPEVFQSFVGQPSEPVPSALQHLVRDPNQKYYVRPGRATLAMQIALQQILQCPYQGLIKRMYLESKVWELMALLLDQEMEARQGKQSLPRLKRDDVDRLYQAREILLQNLDNPPSLMQLARQVGLNECSLKRGFREVFNTTVFGYLRQHRMEQAKALLLEGHMSVHEAAQAVGYTSQSRFAAVFRKTFGVNPKAFSSQSRQ